MLWQFALGGDTRGGNARNMLEYMYLHRMLPIEHAPIPWRYQEWLGPVWRYGTKRERTFHAFAVGWVTGQGKARDSWQRLGVFRCECPWLVGRAMLSGLSPDGAAMGRAS